MTSTVFEESVVLSGTVPEAIESVKAALAEQGFGALTEIDMQATLRSKIGKEIDPYVIIGACNPKLASAALEVDPQIGVLLPCNVVVRASGDDVVVEAMDPGLMVQFVASDSIEPIASEARELIGAAMASLCE